MIVDWLKKGSPYFEGVDILEKNGGNKSLISLMRKKESPYFKKKLEEELQKLQDLIQPEEKESPVISELNKKTISHYPVELHRVFIDRKKSYLESDALKLELNTLAEHEEEKALRIQLEIYQLRKKNQKCWEILKHYDEHKRIIEYESSSNFNELSKDEAWKRRQLNYQNISKRQKRIDLYILELSKITDSKKRIKLEMKIAKKTEELQQIKNDNEKLSNRLN